MRKADSFKVLEGNSIQTYKGKGGCLSGVLEHGMQSRVYGTNMGYPDKSCKGIGFTSIKARKAKCLLGSQMDHSTQEAE
jgi:hypothetical protein